MTIFESMESVVARAHKGTDLVTIEVEDFVPDVLQRITLLHNAFIRVLFNTRLIEVLEADYEKGKMQVVIESKTTRPQIQGKVCVRYEPCPNGNEALLKSTG